MKMSRWQWLFDPLVDWRRFLDVAPKVQVDVDVVSVEPLYPAPELVDYTELSGAPEARLVQFGTDGPIVAIAHHALDAAMSHAQANPTTEIGGMCLGLVKRQQDNRLLIRIEEMIQAEHTIAGLVYLTFTHETWQRFLEVQERDFPQLRLVGWYHSHPGFGVFLSSMDKFIHESFFATPWHIAIVVDPSHQQIGVCAYHNGKVSLPKAFKWVTDLSDLKPVAENDNG